MALTSRVKNKLFDAMNTAFDKIGIANSTAMPSSKNNREAVAWEMMVADELRRRANKRRDAAIDNAIEAGLIPDYKRTPLEPTSVHEIWRGEHTSITAKVVGKKPSCSVDDLVNELVLKHGVNKNTIAKAITNVSRQNAPQHFFEAIPIVVD